MRKEASGFAAGCTALLLLVLLIALEIAGVPQLPTGAQKGIDVSSYQGEIVWELVRSDGIEFAYVKATEGSSHRDPMCAHNLEGANAVGLSCGAYHFFSFETGGAQQAVNFIASVSADSISLPPAVDLELYGEFEFPNHPPRAEVRRELTVLLQMLESHYGSRPLLYVSRMTWVLYVLGDPLPCDLWICDLNGLPFLPHTAISMRQYSVTGRVNGIRGPVDLDIRIR